MITRYVLAALLFACASLVAPASATDQSDQADQSGQARPTVQSDLLRTRDLSIPRAIFNTTEGAHLSLALFDDVIFSITVDRVIRRPTGTAIHGRITGSATGTCTLTLDNGLISAGFWTDRGAFGLTPLSAVDVAADASGLALCRAEQLRPEAVHRCLMAEDPTIPFQSPGHESEALAHGSTRFIPSADPSSTSSPQRGAEPCNCPDDQSIIDILCVYTTLAKNAAGGAAAIQTRFQNALDTANGAFINSGITTSGVNRLQLRAAGYSEITYDEVAPAWLNHLERITAPSDGFMDTVHALRDSFKADTVFLVVNDERFTGGAAWWAIWDQGQAFACGNWRGLGGGSLMLAHEVGHNLGCAHDYEHDASAPLSYAWGHYFSFGGQTYGDIMSYVGDVPLQLYSNPHIIHPASGQPCGVAPGQSRAADNAFVIQQTRWTLANYRDAARITDCNGNGIADATDIASGTSQDLNHNCRPDECESRRYIDADIPGYAEGTSWSLSGGDIGEILDIAHFTCSNISQIWVANGTYKPDKGTADRYRTVKLRSALALYGGFQGRSRPGGGETLLAQRDPASFISILSGAIGTPAATDNSYSVVYAPDATSTAILDGFTIRDGYTDYSGAGLYLEAAAPTIANCLITANRAVAGAGLVMWEPSPGTATLTNCTFTANNAVDGGGGAMGVYAGSLSATNCAFTNNNARWGGAISSNDSTLSLTSCSLIGNHATTDNGGALDMNNEQFTLVNSIVANNTSAKDGAGLWIANSTTANIRNTTIAGNAAGTFTGGLVNYFATANLANTIIWGNTGSLTGQDKQLVYFGGTGTVRYSRIQSWSGSLSGPGNSGANPLLTSIPSGDFTLQPGSSAIDAGDNAALSPSILSDILGNPRRADDPATADTGVGPAPVIDIGATEYQPPAACPADLNGDGLVDFSDYLEFLNLFDALDPRVDFNMDGLVDFSDYLEFLNLYDAGC